LPPDKNSRHRNVRFSFYSPEFVRSLPAFTAKFARVNYPQQDESEFPAGRQAKGFSPSNGAFLSLNVGISESE
jgi:hypothetical protein